VAPPDGVVVVLVLISALLHAAWNAVAKAGRDRLLTLWGVVAVGSLAGAVGVCALPLPERAAWPYLAASLVVHTAYLVSLLRMYRLGDLSEAYPIARGIAPLLVGVGAAWRVGEPLGAAQLAGLALSSLAICGLALAGRARSLDASRAVPAALLSGALIGVYTVIDGQGVRLAGGELRFIAWNFFLDGIPMTLAVLWLRRGQIGAFLRDEGPRSFVGGVVATLGYSIVLWALAQGAMAHVSALRETSVIFAALIGTHLLGEPFGRLRVTAALAVAAGVLLLRLG
jgi:drug/metabolite transporter (DMT)-like permease